MSPKIFMLALLTSTAVSAWAQPTLAQEADSDRAREDRIQDLERKLEVLTDELARVRDQVAVPEAPELTGAYGFGPAASKVYGLDSGLSIGGYGEFFYRSFIGDENAGTDSVDGLQISDHQLDRADALRMVLYLGYKFTDRIVFNSEIEFEHALTGEGTASAESGEVTVEFASLDFFWKDWINYRAGLLLIPMGFLNEVHEPPFFHGVSRTETETRIIPTTWREMGMGFFGELGETVEYRAYVVTGFNARGFSDSGVRGGRQKGNRSLAEDFAFVGRLDWSPTPEWLLGGSFYYGDSGQEQKIGGETDLPEASLMAFELHAQYRHEQLEARALFAYNQLSDARDLNIALDSRLDRPIADKMLGGYVELAYDLWPALFGDYEKYLAPFVRVEYVDTQYEVPSGYSANRRNSYWLYTPGITFKPHPNVALKLEYRNFDTRGAPRPDELAFGMGFAF
jgi:opacity protein-like surface antigen